MKKGTPDHPKTSDLANSLKINVAWACGLLELLWCFARDYAPPGDVGRFSDTAIAKALHWTKSPALLIEALVSAGWLDPCPVHRLIVHDWSDHCEDYVRKKLLRSNRTFVKVQTKSGQSTDKVELRARAVPEPCPAMPCQSGAMPVPEPPAANQNGDIEVRFGTWETDETFAPFVEIYRRSGKPLADPDDFVKAWWNWKVLDFEQMRDRCQRLADGLDAGEWSDPKYIPSPRMFLESKWKVPLPRKAVTKTDATNAAIDKALRREASSRANQA